MNKTQQYISKLTTLIEVFELTARDAANAGTQHPEDAELIRQQHQEVKEQLAAKITSLNYYGDFMDISEDDQVYDLYPEIKLFMSPPEDPSFFMPKAATSGAGAMDVRAAIAKNLYIVPGAICRVPLGFAMNIGTKDVAGLLFPRSGLASKHNITLANSVGLIDSDFQGEVCAMLTNTGNDTFEVRPGMRVAQLAFVPILLPQWVEVTGNFANTTARDPAGFGTTGLEG